MKKLLYLVVLLIMPVAGWSQTAVITGTAVGIGQTLTLPVTLQVQLVGCSPDVPKLIPSGSVITNNFSVTAPSPTFIATATVYGNNIVTCNNQSYSTYAVTWNVNGRPAAPTQNYRVVEGQTCNISDGTCKPIGFYPAVINNATGSMCAAGQNLQGFNSQFVPQCVTAPPVGPAGPQGPAGTPGGAQVSAGITTLLKGTGTLNQTAAAIAGTDFPGLGFANTYSAIQNLSAGINVTGGSSTFANGFAVTAGTPTFAAGLNVTGGTATLPGGYVKNTPTAAQRITQPGTTDLQINSLNGQLNAQFFCAVPFTLDQTCVENALAVSNATGQDVYVPAGSYSGTTSTVSLSNVHLILASNAILNYKLVFSGAGYNITQTQTASGSYTVGATTFTGNFSAFTAGQVVRVNQVNPTGSNQIGDEFFIISSANASQLIISGTTRYTYSAPVLQQITNAQKVTGTIADNAISISGNYTSSLSVGDLVRVDNTTGTDSPLAINAYFQIVKVAAITTSAVTFETSLHSSYGNPWLVRLTTLNNITVSGNGFVDQLYMIYAQKTSVSDITSSSLVSLYTYNYQFNNIRANARQTYATAFQVVFGYSGSISNVVAYGGNSTTDNGNVKLAQIQDTSVTGVSSWYDTDVVQGAYPFMIDFAFNPYSIWNASNALSGITAQTGSVSSFFIAGMKNTTATSLSASGAITLTASNGLFINSMVTTGRLTLRSGNQYHISNFSAESLSIGDDGVVQNSLFSNFSMSQGATAIVAGRVVWIRGSSANLRFTHGLFFPPIVTGSASFYINDNLETGLFFDDITDAPGGGSVSIANPGGVSIGLGVNRFSGTVAGPFTAIPYSNGTSTTMTLTGCTLTFIGGIMITHTGASCP